MNLRETYNTIAEAWHKDHLSDTWWIAGTDCFASLFGNGDSILDVGCGDGMKAKYLTKKGLVVTGIDYAEHMIEIAEREVPSAAFLCTISITLMQCTVDTMASLRKPYCYMFQRGMFR